MMVLAFTPGTERGTQISRHTVLGENLLSHLMRYRGASTPPGIVNSKT